MRQKISYPASIRRQRVWVVFTDQTDLPWLRFLKRGFRHCFVILHDGAHWISIDPLSGRMEIAVQEVSGDFDLPSWLAQQGHIVLRTRLYFNEGCAPVMPFSCVEAVKRILGVHERFIITPWQLYQHLQRPRPIRIQKEEGVLSWEA